MANENYVITAGHCVARARPSQVRVTLGEYVLKSSVEPLPGRTYGVSDIKNVFVEAAIDVSKCVKTYGTPLTSARWEQRDYKRSK